MRISVLLVLVGILWSCCAVAQCIDPYSNAEWPGDAHFEVPSPSATSATLLFGPLSTSIGIDGIDSHSSTVTVTPGKIHITGEFFIGGPTTPPPPHYYPVTVNNVSPGPYEVTVALTRETFSCPAHTFNLVLGGENPGAIPTASPLALTTLFLLLAVVGAVAHRRTTGRHVMHEVSSGD